MTKIEPNSGIEYGWEKSVGGWGAGLNNNFKLIGALLHHAVIDLLSSPPASPALGAVYLVGDAATGDFEGKEGEVAVKFDPTWEFFSVPEGTLFSKGGTLYNLSAGLWEVWGIDPASIPNGSIAESKLSTSVQDKLNNPPISVGDGLVADPTTYQLSLDNNYIVTLIGYDGRAGLQETVPDYVDGGLLPVPTDAAKWLKVSLGGVEYAVPGFLLTEV